MKKEYIADCLAEYAKSDSIRLHMPGHKGKGNGILKDIFPCDITELSFSDNFANPSGVIKLAQEDVARICRAKYSRILTGGSTLGVLSAVFAVKERGKKMIIQRSSHKSVYNALELFGIEPLILNEKTKDGLITGEFFNDELFDMADNEVIGALLTSPDYFGRALDLKDIKQRLSKNGKFLLVDGAHGGHFVFDNPSQYAGNFADIWIDGAHKTLQTLTQGAIIHVNDESLIEKLEEGISVFSTSSPNYLIMASVESGVKRFEDIKRENEKQFAKVKNFLVCELKNAGFDILACDDNLKVTVICKNCDGIKLGEFFESKGIFAELVGENQILFMLAYTFNKEDAKRIISAIKEYKDCGEKETGNKVFPLPKRKIEYVTARTLQREEIDLSVAKGRICAENAGVFPPCYPIITAGEIFDDRVIEALFVKNTFGVKNGKVKVIKE